MSPIGTEASGEHETSGSGTPLRTALLARFQRFAIALFVRTAHLQRHLAETKASATSDDRDEGEDADAAGTADTRRLPTHGLPVTNPDASSPERSEDSSTAFDDQIERRPPTKAWEKGDRLWIYDPDDAESYVSSDVYEDVKP